MFSTNIDYYENELRKVIGSELSLTGFDNKKLKEYLETKPTEGLFITVADGNDSKEQQKFWKALKEDYKNRQHSTYALRYFDVNPDTKQFESFLDLINGQKTQFFLSIGKPHLNITKSALKNNVSALVLENCHEREKIWDKILEALNSSTMLRYLSLKDPSVDQVLRILELQSEIRILKISVEEEEIESFTSNKDLMMALENLEETIFFPNEIQFFVGRKKLADEDIKKRVTKLNERKDTNAFWKKVIDDAIQKHKTTKFSRSKLMFVGKGGAGKTSTIRTLTDKEFREQHVSTNLADAKGQIEVVVQDVEALESTWRVRDGVDDVVIKPDFVNVIRATQKHIDSDLKPALLHERDNKRLDNLEDGRLINEELDENSQFMSVTFELQVSTQQKIKVELNEQEVKPKEKKYTGSRIKRKKLLKKTKKKEKTIRTVSIWDFGGQDVFHTVHHLFLTNNGVYVIVFDFEKMKDEDQRTDQEKDIKFWLDSIYLYAEKAPIFIVATHVKDATNEEFNNVNDFLETIIDDYDGNWTENIEENEKDGVFFFPVENSYKENEDETLFNKKLAQGDYLRKSIDKSFSKNAKNFKLYSREIPLSWIYFMNRLVKDGVRKLEFQEIHEIGLDLGFKPKVIEDIIELYNDYGTILSFRKDKNAHLKNHIILSPQWLVDALKTFIYDPKYHHKNRCRNKPYRKVKNKIKVYAKQTGLMPSSLFKLLLKNATATNNENDIKFFMALFKKMFLATPCSIINNSEVDPIWYIPSMCPNVRPLTQLDKFLVKHEKNQTFLKLQICTKRRHPEGFFERIVCLFLSLSNKAEVNDMPELRRETCCFYLCGTPVYISKKGLLGEDTDDKVVYIYSEMFKRDEMDEDDLGKIARILQSLEHDIIEVIRKDKLGKILEPKLFCLVTEDNIKFEYNKAIKALSDKPESKKLRTEGLTLTIEEIGVLHDVLKLIACDKKPEPSSEKEFDCFIAHEWGSEAFPTHEKAIQLKEKLVAAGLKVWLDEDDIGHNIAGGIVEGLKYSVVVIILLTSRYFSRCQDVNTNAHDEFIAAVKKGKKWLLPIVMQEELERKFPSNTIVEFRLGETKWVSFATEKKKEKYLPDIIKAVKTLVAQKRQE